ncbi:MAG: NFACT RNA binding domain-containing protein [Proteobacteria bacterium]|nr:NFACT RNA binding domain-containing protein [Pseudomonadota bacterium]
MYYPELLRIVTRLSVDCDDARLEHVLDGPHRLELIFQRSASRSRRVVVIDFSPRHLDIYLRATPSKAPAQPQAFTMLLRKYLLGLRLSSLRLSRQDRIVTFEFGYDQVSLYALIIELTGARASVFLIQADSREILGCIRGDAERQTHAPYFFPPPPPALPHCDRFDSIRDEDYFQALEDFFLHRDASEAFLHLRASFEARLSKAITRLRRRLDNLACDFGNAQRYACIRREADLLAAYGRGVPEGASVCELPDFEDGTPVTIQLDPSLSVRANIDKRYAQYKRLHRALPIIQERYQQAEALAEAASVCREALNSAASVQEIEVLAPQIEALTAGLGEKKSPASQQGARPKQAQHVSFKTFMSPKGIRILVGKSAKDNDQLTFRHAKGNDHWLHVAQAPGSHVIVRSEQPDSDTILDAAMLAVHYSKFASAGQAEVHLTQVKFVRRMKGAPAGKVVIRGEKILHVRVEQARLKRILATET